MFTERTSVGLDVHARPIAAVAIDNVTGELFQTKLTPAYDDVRSWIDKLPGSVAVVYEAGPTRFGLYRHLTAAGLRCEVVPPSQLQKRAGDRVKTHLLTELPGSRFEWCVPGGSVLTRFTAVIDDEGPRSLRELVVPLVWTLEATRDVFAPYRLVDGQGAPVLPIAACFTELTACGRPPTARSKGWICCAGSGSCGRSGWSGIRPRGSSASPHPVAAGDGQADTAALALSRRRCSRGRRRAAGGQGECGDRQAVSRRPVRGGHGGALFW